MDPISATIGVIGGLAGGAYQSRQSAKQAAKQREFQREMSNTAYQRAAADLEAAGLNRILALGSPASTPGGAMGNVANFGDIFQQGMGLGSAATSAYAAESQAEAAQSQAETSAKAQQATERQVNSTIKKIAAEIGGIEARKERDIQQTRAVRVIANVVEQVGTDVNDVLTMLRDMRDELGQAIADDIASGHARGARYLHEVLSRWIPHYKGSPIGVGAEILLGSGGPE